MKIQKRLVGKVEYNNGEFAEIETHGTEGIEENLLLETIQVHCEDTEDTPEEFEHRFAVGMWLDVLTTIEINQKYSDAMPLDTSVT